MIRLRVLNLRRMEQVLLTLWSNAIAYSSVASLAKDMLLLSLRCFGKRRYELQTMDGLESWKDTPSLDGASRPVSKKYCTDGGVVCMPNIFVSRNFASTHLEQRPCQDTDTVYNNNRGLE